MSLCNHWGPQRGLYMSLCNYCGPQHGLCMSPCNHWGPSVDCVCPSVTTGAPACVCEQSSSGSHQAVAVAEGHLAGVRPVLQVAYVEALRGVGVAPGQTAPPPVLHPELTGQQPPLQCQVEQEGGARCGQLVEELRGRQEEALSDP